MSLKIYKKNLDYSYTFGIFPTLELLINKPNQCETVLIASKNQNDPHIVSIKELCKKHNINYDIADKAISKIALKEKTHVIGVFKKYYPKLDLDTNHLVLVNPSNPKNVGTIIRSAIGFNINNFAIVNPLIDMYEPNLIRSTMGAYFKINFQYFDDFNLYTKQHFKNNIYTFMLDAKNSLNKTNFNNPCSLVFGNESTGLDKSYSRYNSVKIDHSKNIESLNLSVSASIAMYKLYNR